MIFSEIGKLWQPNDRSVICSAHIAGNTRSKDPRSPSYVPTIFPKVYKRKISDPEQIDSRYKRVLKRQLISKTNDPNLECTSHINVESDIIKTFENACTQTAFDVWPVQSFSFSCEFFGNDVCTQAVITQNIFKTVSQKDTSCGPDSNNYKSCLCCEKFHGFESIQDENQLKDLTGVTSEVFNLLIQFLPTEHFSKFSLSLNDQLLLFLIKIKLGITFSALSVFFKINRRIASRIFFRLLDLLHLKTKHMIFLAWQDFYFWNFTWSIQTKFSQVPLYYRLHWN